MGIRDYSKAFEAEEITTVAHMPNGIRLAIDAMHIIWTAALGAKKVGTLTNAHGYPTMHLKVIFAFIMQFARKNVELVFCFDSMNPEELSIKKAERDRRKKNREAARAGLQRMSEETGIDADLLELTEISNAIEQGTGEDFVVEERKAKLEKSAFSLQQSQILDIMHLLDHLGVSYVIAPQGYEGEYVAVWLEKRGLVDAVFSGDTDVAAFGARTFYRRHPRNKKIYKYTQNHVLRQIGEGATVADLQKICVLLGCDFAARSKGFGPKTTLRRYEDAKLNEEQQKALEFFQKELPMDERPEIRNMQRRQLVDYDRATFLDWICGEFSFTRSLVEKQLDKKIKGVAME